MSVYKTNIVKEGDESWLMHAVIESIPEEIKGEFFKDYDKRSVEHSEKDNLEIELIVNGFSFDVKCFFENLESQYERMLGEKSKELLLENLGDLQNVVGEIRQAMLRTLKEKTGVEISNEDRW